MMMRGLLTALVLVSLRGAAAVAADTPSYAEYQDICYYLATDNAKRPIKSVEDWQVRRCHVLDRVQAVMGPLPRPDACVPLKPEYGKPVTLAGNVVRRKVSYHTDSPEARVNAWLLVPQGGGSRKRPAVLCLHQTIEIGKDEPAGLGENDHLDYALELAQRDYVTLAPDYPSLGEHEHDFESDAYESGSMKAIYDNIRAVDLLCSLPEVDAERMACIGHSLGGHNSIFTAVFEPRLKAIVSCCGFTRFHRYCGGDVTGWTGPRYMPRLATDFGTDPDRIPFDFTELVAALAPRAFLAVAPLRDDNFSVEGVKDVMAAARPIYRLHGHVDRLAADYPDATHDFPDASRQRAYEFIDTHLVHHPAEP